MDSTSTAGATPPDAPVTYPVFAAVALGMTGRSVYEVIELVGGMFERAGAVFEGSPDGPGALLALLPPSEDAAVRALQLGLEAKAAAPTLRLGIDATEVHRKKEQDAKWQHVIDSALRLQKAARTGEAIAGDEAEQLAHGAAATEALRVGNETYLLLTGVRDLAAVPQAAPSVEPPEQVAPVQPVERDESSVEPPSVVEATPVVEPTPVEPTPVDAAEPVAEPEPPSVEPTTVREEPAASEQARVEAGRPPTADFPAPSEEPEPSITIPMHPTARWDGPLVGREAALADLRTRWDRVVSDRSAVCVLVVGDPGSGRTRLVGELAAALDGARVLSVECLPVDTGGARWPLAALVEAIAGLDPFAHADTVLYRLTTLFTGQPDADLVVSHLVGMLALEGTTEADRVRWALRRLLEVSSTDAPTLLRIDDVDRAGAGFVRLIADVATAVRETSALIALTSTRESGGVPAVRVPPLTAEDRTTLVGSLLGAAEPGVDAAVATRTGPTPFDVEQALAMLTETGTLAPGQGRWLPLADLTRVPVPEITTAVIRQRLQTLPPHELAVLGVAAVAGERFTVEPLLAVIPEDARGSVPAHLADLVARGFLVREEPQTFRFRHALLREATITGVPDWAQAATHVEIGRSLERAAGDRRWRHAEAIADHLDAAVRLTPDGPIENRTDAVELLTASADAAVAQGDLDGASRLERRAAALLDDDPKRRAELLYLSVEHGVSAAPDRPADREIAEAALAASVAGDDVDWRVRLLRARLRTLANHDDALEGARATADEAIAAFGEDELGWALSSAWALRGLVHRARSQNGLVVEDLVKAADHAAAADRPNEETAAARGAIAALLDGPVPVAEAAARCASFLSRMHGPLAEHDAQTALALLRARGGSFEDARRAAATSIAALDALGAAGDLAVALRRSAEIELLAGAPSAAEPQLRRALAAATHAHDERLRASLAAAFAHVLVSDDERLDEALALADVAEANAGDIRTQVGWRSARARVMVRRGRGAQAERLVREGLGLAEQTDSTDLRANALLWAADVRRHAGRPAEAEPLERRALRLFERHGATAQAAVVAAIVGGREPSRPTAAIPSDGPGAVTTEAPPEPTAPTPAVQAEPQAVMSTPSTEPDPQPAPDGATTRLADEMMALFAAEPTTPADEPIQPTEPTEPTEPTSQHDLDANTAEEESQRRWFNR